MSKWSNRSRGGTAMWRLAAVLFSVISVLVACQAEPGAVHAFGRYRDVVRAPVWAVADAAVYAVRDMDLRVLSATDREVVAAYPDGTRSFIRIYPQKGPFTRFTVRVEPGHSESLSVETIRRIHEALAQGRRRHQPRGRSGRN